ncbi:hypothetical protein PpBr36_04050 [Pyricularia pennisetigena]|uniref:hypothetical protein n=1 Tax=Pyricularia pennisetigena TaxID=1578925 RepID=UPI00114D6C31|nr:hypothetical protein PpBr36_04050 [Pyricularia pennisetigena]TLS26615.1 hypothetical protein PpBr36_04050 [Pyricularia pennisetigena]
MAGSPLKPASSLLNNAISGTALATDFFDEGDYVLILRQGCGAIAPGNNIASQDTEGQLDECLTVPTKKDDLLVAVQIAVYHCGLKTGVACCFDVKVTTTIEELAQKFCRTDGKPDGYYTILVHGTPIGGSQTLAMETEVADVPLINLRAIVTEHLDKNAPAPPTISSEQRHLLQIRVTQTLMNRYFQQKPNMEIHELNRKRGSGVESDGFHIVWITVHDTQINGECTYSHVFFKINKDVKLWVLARSLCHALRKPAGHYVIFYDAFLIRSTDTLATFPIAWNRKNRIGIHAFPRQVVKLMVDNLLDDQITRDNFWSQQGTLERLRANRRED